MIGMMVSLNILKPFNWIGSKNKNRAAIKLDCGSIYYKV